MRYAPLVVAFCLHLFASADVSAQDNMLAVVERVTAADPARFACAHTGRPCEADWIRAVAAELHAISPSWGLNAKRDGPEHDISLDVVTWRVGPTDRHVRVWDICGACGSSSARPVWNEITQHPIGNPGTARWVRPAQISPKPEPPPAPAPSPTPQPPPPPPHDHAAVLAAIAVLDMRLNALAALVRALEPQVAQAASEALNAAGRASDILTALGQLPGSQPPPCFKGRVPKAFGGSSEVTFCPVP